MQELFQQNLFGQTPDYTGGVMSGRPPVKNAPPFGQRLSDLRRSRGLTQQQLADLLDMSLKAVDYYERRARNPSLEFVRKAAEKLKVSVAELVGADAKPERQRPGPAPKLQRQIEELRRLPRTKQRFVSELLDAVLQQAVAR
jgi:transcriptional regulator with XRE-family HTH domain